MMPRSKPTSGDSGPAAKSEASGTSPPERSHPDSASSDPSAPSVFPTQDLPWNAADLLDLLGERLDDVVWVFNETRGKPIHVSPSFERIWGLPLSQLIDDPACWLNAIHPGDREESQRKFARFTSGEDCFDARYRIRRPDGEIRWIHDRSIRLEERNGDVITFGVARDITVMVNRREERERYEALLESSHRVARMVHWELNLETLTMSAPPLAEELFGVRNLEGVNLDDALSGVHEEDRDDVRRGLKAMAQGRAVFDRTFRYQRPDNGEMVIVHAVAQLDESNTLVVGSAQDVTEHARQEEIRARQAAHLREAQRIANLGTWQISLETRQVVLSPQTCEIYGLDRTEVSDEEARRIPLEHERDRLQASMQQVIEEGVSHDLEFQIRRVNDGAIRTVRTIADFDEATNSVLGTVQDITEQVEQRQRMEQQEAYLREAQRLAGLGAWRINMDDRTVVASDQAHAIYGVDVDVDMTLADIQQIPLKEERASLDQALSALIQEGEAYDHTFRIRRIKDGAVRIVRSIAEYHPETNQVIGTLQDITEQVEREQALKIHQHQLDEVQHLARLGSWEYRLEDDHAVISSESARICGLDCTNLPEDTARALIHEDDLPTLVRVIGDVVHGKQESFDLQFRLHRADDGSIRHMHTVGRYEAGNKLILGSIQDVTEQLEREHELQQARDLFVTLTNNADDYILLLQDQEMVYHNVALARDLGFDPSELRGPFGYLELVTPEERDRIKRYHQTRITGGDEAPESYETLLRTRDGREIPTEVRASRVHYQGRPSVLAILRNIADRHEAERVMRLAEQVMESIPTGLFLYQYEEPDKLNLLKANPQAEALTGILEDEWVGREFNEIFPNARIQGITANFLDVARTGSTYDVSDMSYSDDRLDGYYRIRVFALPQKRIAVAFDDISSQVRAQAKLRESEERLRLFMDASIDGITIWDKNERLLLINKAGENILPVGMTREEALGKTHKELFGRSYAPTVRRALETGEPQREIAVFPSPRIGDRYYDTRALPVGNGVGIIGLDVTAAMEQEQALRESEERLRLFMNSATEIFTLWDSERRLIDLNDAAAAYLPEGVAAEDVLGLQYSDFAGNELIEESKGVLRTGEPFTGRREVTLPSGQKVIMDARIFKVGDGLGVITSDVTRQEEARRRLERSESRFRALFASVPDAIYIHTLEEGQDPQPFLEVNDVAVQQTGYSRDELLSMSFADLDHPELGKDPSAAIHRLLQGECVLFEQVHRTKDGRAIPLEISATTVTYEGTRLIFSTARDISERKRAEEALKRSEQRFRLIFDNMIDAVFVHEVSESFSQSRFLMVNDQACERLGYTHEQLLQLQVKDVDPIDDISIPLEELQDRMMGGEAVTFETVHHTRTGRLIPSEVRASIIDYGGRPAVIAVARDISERKRAEEEVRRSYADLRLAQSIASVGNWSFDPVEGEPRWSEEVYRLYERDPVLGPLKPDEYVGIYEGANLELFETSTKAAIEEGKPYDIELALKVPSGRQKIVRAICEPEPEPGPKGHLLRGTIQDITKIRQVERELETHFSQSIAMLCVADLNTATFTRVNPAFTRVLGYTGEELTSKPFTEFIHPDDLQPTIDVMEQKLQRGDRVISFENRYQSKDGGYRWLEWNSTPNIEEGLLFAVAVDITDRKRAEEKMSRRSEFERILLKLSAHFINLPADKVSPEIDTALREIGEFEEVDRTYVFTFDHHRNSMTNTHEWCAEGVEPEIDVLQDVPADSLPWFMSFMLKLKEFNIARVADLPPEASAEKELFENQDIQSLLCVPMAVQGELIGFLGMDSVCRERSWPREAVSLIQIVADVLASAITRSRTDAEMRRLALAVDQSAETIVITDRKGDIVYVNQTFEEVTGYSRAEALGQNPRILKSGKHGEEFYQDMWGTLKRGEVWRGTMINRRKDGSLYHEVVVISPMRNETGETVNYVAAKQDISKQVKLEEQLRQAHKMEAVGNLAGGIAHDFNNMLTVITGNVDLLLLSLQDEPELRQEIEEIGQTAERAANLTRQLLSFSRKQVLRPKQVVINKLIRESELLLRRAVRENIDISLHLTEPGWTVQIDPVQLDQILINLVVNARDAMPEGGAIEISTLNLGVEQVIDLDEPDMPLTDHVCIEVKDTGAGMDEATLAHIFEPFFTTKDTGKGTGLGLATVYGIVKQSGGTLRVGSLVGTGTTFSIYLPRSLQKADADPDSTVSTRTLQGDERVLVVEDDPMVRRSAVRALELHGYRVDQARDAEMALDILGRGPLPDLVVTDVVMPKMSGGQLVKRMRDQGIDVKVIYMSGYPADAAATEGVLKGAHYIQKPFRMFDFIRMIRDVLDDRI